MEKYGRCTGDLQGREGPAYACELLAAFDLPQEDIQQIYYLVAHHHTYDPIDGLGLSDSGEGRFSGEFVRAARLTRRDHEHIGPYFQDANEAKVVRNPVCSE